MRYNNGACYGYASVGNGSTYKHIIQHAMVLLTLTKEAIFEILKCLMNIVF